MGSRLRPPRAHLELVVREALVERLRRTSAPLVLVNAPAGYGKTTLLTQWLERDGRPFAWLQLAAIHDDAVAFLSYLAAALSNVAELDGEVLDLLGTKEPPIESVILPGLGSAVEAAPPFLLVLDDGHLVRNPACWRYVDLLLEQLPAASRLALASRGDPSLPVPRLRAGGGVTEIRADDLRLTREETHSMLGLHGCEVDDDDLDDLLRVTEGWPTGIYLALLAGNGCPTPDLLGRLHGDRREIAGYLTSEVLDRQPAEMQEFLLRTSILDRLSTSLCREVTGLADAAGLLDRLVRDSLFVTPLDDHDGWYRYHHLFEQLLRAQLERRAPETVRDLHRRASHWFETHDDGERAVRHALAAGVDGDALADLAARACDALLIAGQYERAWRLLSLFDDERIERHPVLALTAAMIGSYVRDARAQRLSRHAMTMDVGDGPAPLGATSLRAWQAVLRATRAPAGVTRMCEDAALACRLQEPDADDWLGYATRMKAMAFYLSGRVQRTVAMVDDQLRGDGGGDPGEMAWWLGVRALIAADQDDWARVAELDRAIQGLPGCLPQVPPVLAHLLWLSHTDDPATIPYLETAGKDLIDFVGATEWRFVLCTDVFGEAALRIGDIAAAQRWAAKAEAVLERYPDAGILRSRTKRLRGALEERRMAEPLTAAERRVLDLLPTQLTAMQMAARLFLTENTVKSHLKHIYRKLGVTTRTGAVDAARKLGLL